MMIKKWSFVQLNFNFHKFFISMDISIKLKYDIYILNKYFKKLLNLNSIFKAIMKEELKMIF